MGAIVYLDVDDEITSAATRIRATEAGPVALVLPSGSRISTSRINFRLLAREAQTRGRRLAIVAGDAATRALAVSAGLAVFGSVAEFEASEGSPRAALPVEPDAPTAIVEVPERGAARGSLREGPRILAPAVPRAPGIGRPGLIAAVAVIAALLIVGAVAGFFLLPTAAVTLTPRSQAIGPLDLTVVADPSVTAADSATLVVPAQTMSFPLEVSDTFPATGKRVVETKAKGSVTFQNCDTGRAVTIPAGSIVSTGSGVRFATSTKITVDRATIHPAFACKAGGTGVTAVKAGPSGNVIAGAIDRIPSGYDPVVLSVTNPAPTTGGTHQEFPKVLQSDVDAALTKLKARLAGAFSTDVKAAAATSGGATVFTGTATMDSPVPSVDPATLVGKDVGTFDLGMTGSGTVIAVDPAPLTTVATATAAGRVSAGYRLVDGSIKVSVGQGTANGQLVSFQVTAEATEVRVVDPGPLREQVKGKSLPSALALLAPYGDARIDVWPDWVTTIPTLDARLTFTLETGATPNPSGSPLPSGSVSP